MTSSMQLYELQLCKINCVVLYIWAICPGWQMLLGMRRHLKRSLSSESAHYHAIASTGHLMAMRSPQRVYSSEKMFRNSEFASFVF